MIHNINHTGKKLLILMFNLIGAFLLLNNRFALIKTDGLLVAVLDSALDVAQGIFVLLQCNLILTLTDDVVS